MFEAPVKLLLGLFTGFLFGFLLQKGQVAKYRVILGQLLLRDWTVVKIMATAIAVGAVGVYALVALGAASLHVKPAALGSVLLGATLFGIGLALFGYCPGTSVAASGEGRRDAMVGMLGMLLGAGAYVALYPALQGIAKALPDWGEVTLPQVTATSPWPWVAGLALGVLAVFASVERIRRGESRPPERRRAVGLP